jgi:hypothetical protein
MLVHPSIQPPAVAAVAAWMLQALVRQHRVTVLTWRPVEVDPINRFFGTSLGASDFDRLLAPRSWRAAIDSLPVPAALLRSALLMRHVRRVSDMFDVIVGSHNEIDYGRRCIQYIHYPTYLRPRPAVDLRPYHRFQWLLKRYYSIADRLADFSDRMKANLRWQIPIGRRHACTINWASMPERSIHRLSARLMACRGTNGAVRFLQSAGSRPRRNTSG